MSSGRSSCQVLGVTPLPQVPLNSEDPKLSDLLATILPAAKMLINSLKQTDGNTQWKKGKTFNHNYTNHGRAAIKTLSARAPPGAEPGQDKWFARESRHKLGWGLMANYLLKNHSSNQLRYIPSLLEARLVQTIVPGEIEVWQTAHSFGPLATPRDFVSLVIALDCSEPGVLDFQPDFPHGQKRLTVITVPCEHPDAPPRGGYVRARCASVEEVEEVTEGGVAWRAAQTTSMGGVFPRCVQEMSTPGQMALDVPNFLDFLESRRGSNDELKYESPFETVPATVS